MYRVADSKGGHALLASEFLSLSRLFPYKMRIVPNVHLRYMTMRLIHCFLPPIPFKFPNPPLNVQDMNFKTLCSKYTSNCTRSYLLCKMIFMSKIVFHITSIMDDYSKMFDVLC